MALTIAIGTSLLQGMHPRSAQEKYLNIKDVGLKDGSRCRTNWAGVEKFHEHEPKIWFACRQRRLWWAALASIERQWPPIIFFSYDDGALFWIEAL